MTKSNKIIIAIVAVIAVIALSCIFGYNSLVSSKSEVDEKFSTIDTYLQRRNDLIPNIVNSVKGYASHESEVFSEVSDARAKLAGASSTKDTVEADSELSGAISRLLMVAENYPELKADTQFTALTDELSGTENRIAVARKDYNEAAKLYNASIKKFPKVILAKMFGFDSVEYFKASEESKQVPKVEF